VLYLHDERTTRPEHDGDHPLIRLVISVLGFSIAEALDFVDNSDSMRSSTGGLTPFMKGLEVQRTSMSVNELAMPFSVIILMSYNSCLCLLLLIGPPPSTTYDDQ